MDGEGEMGNQIENLIVLDSSWMENIYDFLPFSFFYFFWVCVEEYEHVTLVEKCVDEKVERLVYICSYLQVLRGRD